MPLVYGRQKGQSLLLVEQLALLPTIAMLLQQPTFKMP